MPPRHAPLRYRFAMVTLETRLYDGSHVSLIGAGVILDDVCGGGPHHVDRDIKQWEECIDVDQWDDRVKAGGSELVAKDPDPQFELDRKGLRSWSVSPPTTDSRL